MNSFIMRIGVYFFTVLLISCFVKEESYEIIVSGETSEDAEFLVIGKDTIAVVEGFFIDTLFNANDEYHYLKLSTWKWPRIVYLQSKGKYQLNFENDWILSENDILNEFLLNRDSILSPYNARWDMTEDEFKSAWEAEFPLNMYKIDSFFNEITISPILIDEVKQMEYLTRGHLTANFISYQERKGLNIDRSIYSFSEHIDFSNERLAFHLSNQNFQYFYFMDKTNKDLPDSIYPFAAVDTINKYVTIKKIKERIIRGIVKSGLYDESVDHDELFQMYEKNIGGLSAEDPIVELYDQIQRLKPGNQSPDFGLLNDINGDEFSIDDLKGKIVLISVWGTWCPFCKEELPYIKKLLKKYPESLESVAVSMDRDLEKWKDYVEKNEWKGIHLNDPKRGSLFRKNYLISGTNIYYLLNQEGEIVANNFKPSDNELDSLIQSLSSRNEK